MFVPILIGSDSDRPFALKISEVLEKFGVPYEIKVLSAHKVPEMLLEYVKDKNKEENICYITIAGRSNGLSGVTAGSSIHPVIACPPFKDKEDMMVNIHSTLQMPSDTPVLTVIDPGNAALCAIRILALKDDSLREKMKRHLAEVKKKFKEPLKNH